MIGETCDDRGHSMLPGTYGLESIWLKLSCPFEPLSSRRIRAGLFLSCRSWFSEGMLSVSPFLASRRS